MCNPQTNCDDDLAVAALLVYSTYRAINHQRFNATLQPASIHDAMKQWVREGARGHANAVKVLSGRWRNGGGSQVAPETLQIETVRRLRRRIA
jgi:hypothetical protein